VKTNAIAISIIKDAEGLELNAYPDPGSSLGQHCRRLGLRMHEYRNIKDWESLSGAPWTIGWGYTGMDVRPGTVWTVSQAEAAFQHSLAEKELLVGEIFDDCAINENQFSALVSFAYNNRFSALRALHRAACASGHFNPDHLLAELKGYVFAGGKIMRGLTARRAREAWLFQRTIK
jgi:lysozyme